LASPLRRLCAFGAAFLVIAVPSVQSAYPADPSHGDVTAVRIIDQLPPDGPYERIWQPFIARWSQLRYVVSYGLQLRAKPDMGDVVCSISNDRGETWTPPIMIFDHRVPNGAVRYAYNNSVLFKDPNQDVLWCYAMRCPQHFPNSEDSQLCAAFSGDGGYSWHPVELVMDYHLTLITCAGIVPVTADGRTRYLLPVHRNTKRRDPRGTRDQFVLESSDLLRWKLAGYVPQPTDREVFIHEGGIAAGDQPGELKMVMRTATYDRERVLDPPIAYSSVSRDGGRTWSTAVPEPELPNYRAKSFYGRDRAGREIYISNDHADRHGLLYRLRSSGGEWSVPRVFFHADTRNSYPTLIEESPGEWLCVWDSSTDPEQRRTAIRFGRLNLDK
jgi:hypothetical protein